METTPSINGACSVTTYKSKVALKDATTSKHQVRTNSWGAGRQMLVAFGFNSYNNSHRVGIYGGAEGNGYDRCFSITEYKNANPYGPAVIKWSNKNVNF